MKAKIGTKYHYYEWGDEGCGNVTVWHAEDGFVKTDGKMDRQKALELGATFDCPYP